MAAATHEEVAVTVLPSAPPSTSLSPAFCALDPAVLRHLILFLRDRDITTLAQVSRAWRVAVRDDEVLWHTLLARSFRLAPHAVSPAPSAAREEYIMRYQRHHRRTRARLEARERARRLAAMKVKQRRTMRVQAVVHGCCGVFLPVAMLLVFILTLGEKLDKEEAASAAGFGQHTVDLSFADAFTPLFVGCGCLAVSACFYAATARARHFEATSLFGGQHNYLQSHTIWAPLHTLTMRGGTRKSNPYCAFLLLLLFVQLVLLPLRLDGTTGGSWGLTFIPFFLFVPLLLGSRVWGRMFRRNVPGHVMISVLFTLFFLPLVILGALAGDGVHIPMSLLLLPCWIVLGAFTLGGCCVAAFFCIEMRHRPRRVRREACAAVVGGFFASVMVVGPWFLSELFLTLKDSNQSSMQYSTALMPVTIFLSLLSAAALALGVATMRTMLRIANRRMV